jgi:hypothetical protein
LYKTGFKKKSHILASSFSIFRSYVHLQHKMMWCVCLMYMCDKVYREPRSLPQVMLEEPYAPGAPSRKRGMFATILPVDSGNSHGKRFRMLRWLCDRFFDQQ